MTRTRHTFGRWHRLLLVAPSALLMLLEPVGCDRAGGDEREEEQQMLRSERLARERARLARNERTRRRNERWRAKDPPRTRPAPPRPCVPAEELKRRVGSAAFNDRFGRSVRRVLAPIKADLVVLQGRPVQRFTFAVRMHPTEEPRFGRKPARPLLELELRYEPLCLDKGMPGFLHAGKKRGEPPTQILQVRLAHAKEDRKRRGWTTSLWPQKGGPRRATVPVGRSLQLLLDPANGRLRAGSARPVGGGLWRITRARFPDRPRLRRISLPSSKLPDSLNVLHAVEVPCSQSPRKRCRFLTRQQGHHTLVMSLKELFRRAAPIKQRERVLHLHAAVLALRYPGCGGDTRRPNATTIKHPCVRSPAVAGRRACQFWRAQHGYAVRPTVHKLQSTWHLTRVISCPAKKLRVLQLDETYSPNGKHSHRVTDLTRRTRKIDAALRRLTRRRRRR